jgi:hypothetical protein
VISASHSSNCESGRAFSAGMEPITPLTHWAITVLGVLMMNSGAEMTGKVIEEKMAGSLDMKGFV